MMRLQWTSELDIDALEAKGHWVTMEELLEVVGRYLPHYEVAQYVQDSAQPCNGQFSGAQTQTFSVYPM